MNYSTYHMDRVLAPAVLEADQQRELLEVIDQGTDRAAAEAAFQPHDSSRMLLEGIYDHIAAFQDHATPEAQEAHSVLVEHSTRLVRFVGARLMRGADVQHLEADDLFQEGWPALSLAGWQYDLSSSAKFSTYAVRCIGNRLSRVLDTYDSVIRQPVNTRENARKVRKMLPGMRLDGRVSDAMQDEVSAVTGSAGDAKRVIDYESTFRHVRSLDESFGRKKVDYFDLDGQPTTRSTQNDITDAVMTKAHVEMMDEIDWSTTIATIADMMLGLPYLNEREKLILALRFGMVDGKPQTLEQISEVIGVSRPRISQIEAKAMSKIRVTEGIENPFTGRSIKRKADKRETDESPEAYEQAWEALRAKQDRQHAWGAFVADLVDSGQYTRGQVLRAAHAVTGYVRPGKKHPFLDEVKNRTRGVIEVSQVPDVRDASIASEIRDWLEDTQ